MWLAGWLGAVTAKPNFRGIDNTKVGTGVRAGAGSLPLLSLERGAAAGGMNAQQLGKRGSQEYGGEEKGLMLALLHVNQRELSVHVGFFH